MEELDGEERDEEVGKKPRQCCVGVIIRIVDGSLFLLVDDLFCSVVSTTIFVLGSIN